jgi:hypothetical protein
MLYLRGSVVVRYLLVTLLLSASLTSFSTSEAQSKSPPYPIELIDPGYWSESRVACAITNKHRVSCWGDGMPDAAKRAMVEAADVASFTWGSEIYCYIKLDTSVACSTGNLPLGVQNAKAIRASGDNFCFLDLNNYLSCWRWNSGWDNLLSQPLESVTSFDLLYSGGPRIRLCAVTDELLKCWLTGVYIQPRVDDTVPQGVRGVKSVVWLSDGVVCAVQSNGSPNCWPEWNETDPRRQFYQSKGVEAILYDPDAGPCTVSTSGSFKCYTWMNAKPTMRQIDSGVKQVAFYRDGACLLMLTNKAWCVNWSKKGTEINFDSKLNKVVLTGNYTLISGRVGAWQFNKPTQIQVRSKVGESKKWSNWSVYRLTSNGRFSFRKRVDLNTQFQLQVLESDALEKLFNKATFAVEARPKSETFTYKVKRKYINNFLQGATMSYSFKTDPRYQGACVVTAKTQNAFNFAMTYMGPYANSGFAKVSNGVCTGSFDVRYNGKFTLSVGATSNLFTEYFNQESFLLQATG